MASRQIHAVRSTRIFWCTCVETVTAGYPCRHFFTAHRHAQWAGFHIHLINPRWHLKPLEDAILYTYGNKATAVKVEFMLDMQERATSVHCAALGKAVHIPVREQLEAQRTYGKLWGAARTSASLICVDYGTIQAEEAEEFLKCVKAITDRIKHKEELKRAAPEDRALLKAKQAVAHVQDIRCPDKRARGARICSICKSTQHTKSKCPHQPKENTGP